MSRRLFSRLPLLYLLLVVLFTLPMIQAPRRAGAEGGFIPAAGRVDMVHDHTRNRIYITTGGNQVLRWDVASNSPLPAITVPRAGSQLHGIDISPDDRWLVVADRTRNGELLTIWSIDLRLETIKQVEYARYWSEGGSYAVAFGNDGAALISHTYEGSGSVMLRRWDPVADTMTQLQQVSQWSMLTASGNGSVIGIAEANNSGGPLKRYRVADRSVFGSHGHGTGWYNFEIGVDRTGSQFAVPVYGGTFFYDANLTKVGPTVGTYAGSQPIGVVYHPHQDIVYFPFTGTNEVRAFDTKTFAQIGAYNFEHLFEHTGNWAYSQGRMRISRDGALLMGTVNGGVRVVQIGERQQLAHNRTVRTLEDTPVSFNLTGSGGDGGTFEVVQPPLNGALSGEAPGLTYTPAANTFGQDSLQFRIVGNAATPPATVTLVTTPVNDAPSFLKGADIEATDTDGARVVTGWATGMNPGPNETGQTLSFLTSNNSSGLFSVQPSVDPDGTLRFTPVQGTTGIATVTVQVKDTGGTANGGVDTSAPQTFTINVRSVNKPPVAGPDSATTAEDTEVTVDVLANDTDPDGDALSISALGQPIRGRVRLEAGKIVFAPQPNYHGTDYFSYTLRDARGGIAAGNVSVTITPVNDAPRAYGEVWSPYEDMPQNVNLFGRDVEGDPITYIVVTQPTNGTLTGTAPNLTYTPNPNYYGTDTFTFKVNDGQADSNIATTTLNVRSVNDPPVVQNETVTTPEDTPVIVDVLANDSDVDGDVLRVEAPAGGDNAPATVVDGKLRITPRRDYFGGAVVTYRVNDGKGAVVVGQVNLTITPVPDPPIATGWQYGGMEDTPISVQLRGYDPDGSPITYTVLTQPSSGTLTGTAPNLTYTPAPNFTGTVSFQFKVNDGQSDSAPATIYVSMQPVDDAPVANPDSYTTDEDTPLSIAAPGVLANDSDVEGSPLTASRVASPAHGTLSLNQNGSFTYTPEPNYHGPDSFSYLPIAQGNQGVPVKVTLTVRPVADLPTSGSESYSVDEDGTLTVGAPGVLGNDSDADGDALTAVKHTDPSHGTVTLNSDGSFTYTPNPGFHGGDGFSYCASGGGGLGMPSVVTITVKSVNDAPVAVDDTVSTPEDTAVEIEVLTNDRDPDIEAIALVSATQASNGTVQVNGPRVVYTPNPNFHGTDSFSYTVEDFGGARATARVTVTVTPVNDAPVAQAQSKSTNEDTPVSITLSGSDPEGAALTYTVVTPPTRGTLTGIAPNLVYRPNANVNGPDSFTFRVSDGQASSAPATVTLNVTPVNDLPVAVPDSASTNKNTSVRISVLANDQDPDGGPLTLVSTTAPRNGTATRNADGTVTYAPKRGYSGTDTFSYTVQDAGGSTATATVTVTVRR